MYISTFYMLLYVLCRLNSETNLIMMNSSIKGKIQELVILFK